MKDHQEILEKIEDYLHHRMTDKEHAIFENQIANNESLAKKVKEAKITNEAIHLAALADIRNTVAIDIKKIKYDSGNDWRKISLIISGVLILSAILLITLFKVSKLSNSNKISSADIEPVKIPEIISKPFIDSLTAKTAFDSIPFPVNKNEAVDKIHNDKLKMNFRESVPPKANIKLLEKESLINTPEEISNKSVDTVAITPPPLSVISNEKSECNKQFEIRIEPACANTESGKIYISTDETISYSFHLADISSNGTNGKFTNLPSGEHTLIINYNEGCTFSKVINIKEKWCPMNVSYSFNPDYHEQWEPKYQKGSDGMYIIFDKFGKEIYQSTFGSGNEAWDGTDNHGNKVSLGSYVAMIQYSDGRKEKVDLTIVR